jgi:hypothetical protein
MNKICPVCGIEFETNRKEKTYCSHKCYLESNEKQRIIRKFKKERNISPISCLICGKSFIPVGVRRLTCSSECAKKRKRFLKDKWLDDHADFVEKLRKEYNKKYYENPEIIKKSQERQERVKTRKLKNDLKLLNVVINKVIRKQIMIREKIRQCSLCKEIKPVQEMVGGKNTWCKECALIEKQKDRLLNPEKFKEQYRQANIRMKLDPVKYIRARIRDRLAKAVKRYARGTTISGSKLRYLGCSAKEAVCYLEVKFKPGMNWNNYGWDGWHIDHIIPVSAFDLTKEEERKQAFHYTNLQPLWAIENISKGDSGNRRTRKNDLIKIKT